MYSHQGTEPTFEKETPGGADASANAADEANDADDETREREQGELNVKIHGVHSLQCNKYIFIL